MTREEAINYLQQIADSASLPRYAEALNMAIAALREQPRWIGVEERLPEEWKDESGELVNYVVFIPEYGVDIGNYAKPVERWLCMGLPIKVTHWMPLPEPPEVEG